MLSAVRFVEYCRICSDLVNELRIDSVVPLYKTKNKTVLKKKNFLGIMRSKNETDYKQRWMYLCDLFEI